MNKRIRYINNADGTKQSMRRILGPHEFTFTVVLNNHTSATIIRDDLESINITASSPHKLKIKVKEALISNGCIFEKETRKPRKDDTNSGPA